MARRHLRLREPGWRHGLLINGIGAFTTLVVTVVIAVTKFTHGAWAVMVFVPIMVWLLVRMNRMYEREHVELDENLAAFERRPIEPPTVVVLVDGLDRQTLHALQYARTIRTRRVVALHVDTDAERSRALREAWPTLATDIALEVVDEADGVPATVAAFVRGLPGDADVSVVLPARAESPPGERVRRWRHAARIAKELLRVDRARLTVVRDHPGPGHGSDAGDRRIAPRRGHRAVVLVDRADRATLRAIQYALSLGADEVTAVHAAVDREREEHLIGRWMDLRVPVPLDVIECWDRNVPRALEQYVVEKMSRRYEVTVVMPRRDYATLRQRILHDRTSRRIARAVGRYEHVDVAVVPYYFHRVPTDASPPGPAEPAHPASPTKPSPTGTAAR
jgi:hypothetical protein